MRVFITGIEGFVGRHLVMELVKAGHEVSGLYFDKMDLDEIEALAERLYRGDLRDSVSLNQILDSARPDAIVHLAAISFVPAASSDPRTAWDINLGGTLNILEWIRVAKPDTHLLFVSTSEVYGRSDGGDLPFTEETPLRPANMYSATKASADMAADQYRSLFSLRIATLRPANHIGPGQSENFVVSSFARQVAEAALGLGDGVIRVGNLSAMRDFLDVRDVVRAYRLVLEQQITGIFNLGSGKAERISDILDSLVEIAGARISVVVDKERLRPVDVPIIFISREKLSAESGWTPEIPLIKTLEDTLKCWKDKLRK